MTYKIVLDSGEEIGHYKSTKSPAQVAKSIIKTIYIQNKLKGDFDKIVIFRNNRTHRNYTYHCSISLLRHPITKQIGKNTFVEKYHIVAKRV